MRYDKSTAIYLIGDKRPKSMKAIAHGKKFYSVYLKGSILGPLLFNIFMCDLS